MSVESLSALLSGSRPAEHCIAFVYGRRISLSRLRSDVFHNAQRLAARGVRRAAVVSESGYWFIVGILALLHSGADAILPPNAQPGTLKSFTGEIDAVLSDSATARSPEAIALEAGPAEVGPFTADFDKQRIYFFTSGSTGETKAVEKSLAMFEREAAVLERMWGAELGEIPAIGTVTHQHVFGMTFRIMWPITAGRPFHSEFHIAWEALIAQLDGPSMIVTSPAQLTRLGGLAPLCAENGPRHDNSRRRAVAVRCRKRGGFDFRLRAHRNIRQHRGRRHRMASQRDGACALATHCRRSRLPRTLTAC